MPPADSTPRRTIRAPGTRRPGAGSLIARARARPLALAGAGIVVAEAVLALLGATWSPLAAAALLAGPGLAWVPALPCRLRRERLAAVAAAPALSFALASVALITISRIGIPLTGTSVRLTLLALVAIGLALPGEEPRERAPAWAAVALAAAMGVAAVLAGRVISGFPVPGNDWAKYVLYADQIRREHKLLIDNPFWMLGVPFREDPGAPAVYGSFLLLTGVPAATLAHAAWVLSVAALGSAYTWVRSFAPAAAAVLTAALLAVTPATQDILGWQGVANLGALLIMPLALGLALPAVRDRLGWTEIAGAALLLVALTAAHRLSVVVTGVTLVLTVLILGRGHWRRVWTNVWRIAVAGVVLGAGVAADVIARQRTFGGSLPYSDYLDTKLNLVAGAKDLTWALCGAALIAAILFVVRRRREAGLVAPVVLFGVSLALIFAWVVHVPLAYLRMAYYLPLGLAPLVAVALVRVVPRRLSPVLAVALLAVMAVAAWPQAARVRRYYAFTDTAALRGLDLVSARLRPDEVVATDRCWSFLATWLLRTRTLPALDPADIQPAAELPIAREAHAVVDDTPAGRAAARRLGVRFLVADPTCSSPDGHKLPPPRGATPLYASSRLVVFRLHR